VRSISHSWSSCEGRRSDIIRSALGADLPPSGCGPWAQSTPSGSAKPHGNRHRPKGRPKILLPPAPGPGGECPRRRRLAGARPCPRAAPVTTRRRIPVTVATAAIACVEGMPMYPRNDSIVKSAHHRATLLGLAALAAGVVLLLGLLGKAFAQSGGLDCSGAIASTVHLWPPNHAMVPVAINGVTDPDGGPVHIAITGITQDEPLAGAMPDGMVDRNGVAWVRATRSSSGNGRVYHIAFVATDDHGGRCDGEVAVCVPHDQRSEGACVDDGQAFNSLGSGPGPTPPPGS